MAILTPRSREGTTRAVRAASQVTSRYCASLGGQGAAEPDNPLSRFPVRLDGVRTGVVSLPVIQPIRRNLAEQ